MRKRGYLQNGEEAFDADSGEYRQKHADYNRTSIEKDAADQLAFQKQQDSLMAELVATNNTVGTNDMGETRSTPQVNIVPEPDAQASEQSGANEEQLAMLGKSGETQSTQEKLLITGEKTNILLGQLVSKQEEGNDLSAKINQNVSV